MIDDFNASERHNYDDQALGRLTAIYENKWPLGLSDYLFLNDILDQIEFLEDSRDKNGVR